MSTIEKELDFSDGIIYNKIQAKDIIDKCAIIASNQLDKPGELFKIHITTVKKEPKGIRLTNEKQVNKDNWLAQITIKYDDTYEKIFIEFYCIPKNVKSLKSKEIRKAIKVKKTIPMDTSDIKTTLEIFDASFDDMFSDVHLQAIGGKISIPVLNAVESAIEWPFKKLLEILKPK